MSYGVTRRSGSFRIGPKYVEGCITILVLKLITRTGTGIYIVRSTLVDTSNASYITVHSAKACIAVIAIPISSLVSYSVFGHLSVSNSTVAR
jgi:hypothetical protein